MAKNTEDFITEAEAMQLTGYQRTTLYFLRRDNKVEWTATDTGRKIRYKKRDLEKLIGL